MRLFRSEEQIPSGGAAMPVEQLWQLARAWYGDRMDPDWQPRARDESRAILADVGLTGPFWELP